MSDYDCIQNRRNMIVGAFVVVGVLIFAYMIFLFGELPVVMTKFTSYTVKVRFPFAPGVEQNTPVRYCGYQVGRVTHVAPPVEEVRDDKLIHQVAVTMAISRDYTTIPYNVKVKLLRRGMGSSYIELSSEPMTVTDSLEPNKPKFLVDGTELQGQSGAASEIMPEELQDKLLSFFTKVTNLVDNANEIIGDEQNKSNLKNSLANLSKVTEESIVTLQQIKEFSTTANQKMAMMSDSVLDTSEKLGETLIEMRRVLNKINSGEGTIGKLINDDKLYENLIDSSEELKASLEKMKKTLEKTSQKGIRVKVF